MRQNEREEREMTSEELAVIEAARKYNETLDTTDWVAFLAAASALPPATPPAPEPETREVRIAVAIDRNGNAGVAVVTHGDDAEALEYAGEWTDSLIVAQGIVPARIPVIAIPVVPGTVEAV
jgi:hypothetical protein